jgi:uracil-DNA glycosylase family 4
LSRVVAETPTMAKAAAGEGLLRAQAEGCKRCPQLVASRSQVVFGSGAVDADLMFIGEAPGATEDREGVPFVGASGKLLDELLAGIGIDRSQVYIANVLKCRPPDNRDPRSDEISNCFEYLERQIELTAPVVVVTLGNFATKLLRADDTGITEIHGQVEACTVGVRTVWLCPVFHPAAALYRRPNLDLLRSDFAKLPALIERGAPEQAPLSPSREPHREDAKPIVTNTAPASPVPQGTDADGKPQLDLF